MKTPIQELIEQLEEIKAKEQFELNKLISSTNSTKRKEFLSGEAHGLYLSISIAKKYLEKEKQVIVEAYNEGAISQKRASDPRLNYPLPSAGVYYNEKFGEK